jgi:DNA-binding beta-propeller fold protein YncE
MGKSVLVTAVAAIGTVLAVAHAGAQPAKGAPPVDYAITSSPAKDGMPAWFIRGSYTLTGPTSVAPGGKVTVLQRTPARGPARANLVPYCERSIICANPAGPARTAMLRVTYQENLGYTHQYPYNMPTSAGGAVAVALDKANNLWVLQRTAPGTPKLFKFDANAKLILTVPESVTGDMLKAHGMKADADGNVWILDTSWATARKISPDGKLLQTIGTSGKRGDWDEAKGQRLLWEPVMVDFGANGDIYIAQGHGHESPNDVGLNDPANNLGNSRILHLDRNGKFKNQYFGNNHGPGKFYSAHGFAVDPKTGNLWIGDREDYRIVVLTADGKFVKTIQTTNLVCAIQFDAQGEPWYASGQDGQFLKIDRDGKVLGAIGRGMGIGEGEFMEASYWSFDADNNLYAGDTNIARITKMVAPKR